VAPAANQAVPTSAPSPVASPTPSSLTVGNTGGEGVFIRRTLDAADRIRAWPDKTIMVVVGGDQQAEGRTWKNVKDPDGNVGWVPSEYLVAETNLAVVGTATVVR
jgi:hypothetical protein